MAASFDCASPDDSEAPLRMLRDRLRNPYHSAWAGRIEAELRGNILPFWQAHTVDRVNGGFFGALTNGLTVHDEVERSSVLCSRILWTYSAAYRRYGDPAYLEMARHAFAALTGPFWDRGHGGVYWSVDRGGAVLVDHKRIFGQAYAIYGLAEFHRATGDPHALRLAQELFRLIESHAADALSGGYVERLGRAWGRLDDAQLAAAGIHAAKSMNTQLHVMEAYSNLLAAWDDAGLRARLADLIRVFLDHVIDPATHHLRLFFDDRWRPLGETISFGHDIEASWLLVEAAERVGEADLLGRARAAAVALADRVVAEGVELDGSLLYEAGPGASAHATEKHWWPHAEAVVGFYNAHQVSGELRFAAAAARAWDYIAAHFVDRTHGDWFKVLDRRGAPDPGRFKVGPWECPYHQGRMCLEMLARL